MQEKLSSRFSTVIQRQASFLLAASIVSTASCEYKKGKFLPAMDKLAHSENEQNIVVIKNESGFFEDYEIEDKSYAMGYLCDKLTDKFILGELNEDIEEYVFTEDEMEKILREIIAGTYLTELQDKGLVDSIEDNNEEERFFLIRKAV
jgi:hypothetical protein